MLAWQEYYFLVKYAFNTQDLALPPRFPANVKMIYIHFSIAFGTRISVRVCDSYINPSNNVRVVSIKVDVFY